MLVHQIFINRKVFVRKTFLLTLSSNEVKEVMDLSQRLHRLQGGQSTLSHQCIHAGVILHGPNDTETQ